MLRSLLSQLIDKRGCGTIDSDRRYIGRLRGTCKRTAQNFFIKFNKNDQSQLKFNPIASIFIQITINIILENPRDR